MFRRLFSPVAPSLAIHPSFTAHCIYFDIHSLRNDRADIVWTNNSPPPLVHLTSQSTNLRSLLVICLHTANLTTLERLVCCLVAPTLSIWPSLTRNGSVGRFRLLRPYQTKHCLVQSNKLPAFRQGSIQGFPSAKCLANTLKRCDESLLNDIQTET